MANIRFFLGFHAQRVALFARRRLVLGEKCRGYVYGYRNLQLIVQRLSQKDMLSKKNDKASCKNNVRYYLKKMPYYLNNIGHCFRENSQPRSYSLSSTNKIGRKPSKVSSRFVDIYLNLSLGLICSNSCSSSSI